jgi:signal transduction histidine kinase
MLLHARDKPRSFQDTNINELLIEFIRIAYHAEREKDSSFQVNIQTDLDQTLDPIYVNKHEISRMILNILDNAFYGVRKKQKRMEEKEYQPIISIKTRNHEDHIEVIVYDNGIGVPANIQGKIFMPFFSQKSPGEGLGLGLSVSHDIIVKEHGGTLKLSSQEGEYTQICITIPKKNTQKEVDPNG